MRSRFLVTGVIAAALLSVNFFGIAPPAFASCAGLSKDELATLRGLKSELADMKTDDPAVINRNFDRATKDVAFLRQRLNESGLAGAAIIEKLTLPAYEDELEFWREKKARLETGGVVDVHSGGRWTSYLHNQIDELERRIVGTWNWWNGYTVTFNANGGATYRGSSLVRSGVGRWQNTGGNNYHVHWLTSNTNDYFTLSSDGTKLEGTYDGKPGVSTRKC